MPTRFKFFYISVFVFFPLISFSQSDSATFKKHSITASFGLSLPIEQYKKSYSEESFPASVGYALKLEGSYQVKDRIYASLSLGYFVNPLSKKNHEPVYLSDHRTLNYRIANENRKNIYVLIGPSYEIRSNKFAVDFKIKSGVILTLEPDLKRVYTSYYNSSGIQIDPVRQKPFVYSTTTDSVETKGTTRSSLAFSFASGYSYAISKRVDVLLDLDLLFGNPKQVSVLNLSLGVKYLISKE